MKPATRIHGLHGLKPLAKEIQQRHAQQLALRQAQEAAARQAERERNLFALTVGAVTPLPVKNIYQNKSKNIPPEPLQLHIDEQNVLREAMSDEFDISTLLEVDELMKGLNLPVKKKNGLRVTPADQIDIITGALAGTANKTLLAWAKKHQIAAVGLFLGDGDSVKVTQLDEELGHVGLAQPGSPKLINSLLENGYLPVVSSIGVTDEGQLMNVNADQAATALAATLGADLILLSDVSGILDGKGQRIAEMTAAKAEQLIEQGIITDGMIVKVNAALDAARTLGRPVDIASWRHAEQLPALFNGMPMGTRILA